VLEAFSDAQIRLRDPTGARTALFSRSNRYGAHVGDVLMVTMRRGGEPFAGVLMSIRRAGIDTAILLRGQVTKVGVEMWYKLYSSKISGIEIVWRRPKRARRARLTYMRKPKHDMGSVDHLVLAWRRSRRVIGSRIAGGKGAKGKGAGQRK
jgi:large subunit ribosomal protein L19